MMTSAIMAVLTQHLVYSTGSFATTLIVSRSMMRLPRLRRMFQQLRGANTLLASLMTSAGSKMLALMVLAQGLTISATRLLPTRPSTIQLLYGVLSPLKIDATEFSVMLISNALSIILVSCSVRTRAVPLSNATTPTSISSTLTLRRQS